MKIKTLNNPQKKRITIVTITSVCLLSAVIIGTSLAKYQRSKSINIAKGTVNYKQPDLNLVSVYLEDEDNIYKPISNGKIPTTGYTLNEDITKTRCEIKGTTDTNITITYENGEVSFSKLTTAGTKCYLYFDKIKDTEPPTIGIHEARNVEKTSMDLYVEATDNMSIAGYYFKLSTSSEWSPAKCVGENKCINSVTNLNPNTSYTYDIKVCDTNENCSTATITEKTKSDGIPSGITAATLLDYSKNKQEGTPDFSKIDGNGLYTWTNGDYSGGSQTIKYFRGNVDNNWVVFGKDGDQYIWWRIIRNNSNGSLRMIYAGLSDNKTTAPGATAEDTRIGTSAFNSNTPANNNMYVGFKYTNNQVHGTGTNSTILGTETSTSSSFSLYDWYNTTLKINTLYSNKIDLNAGFCNDRTAAPYQNEGVGTTETNYAAYNRFKNSQTPSLLCQNNTDIFTTPIGLITADEAAIGGMVFDDYQRNTNTYLYSNLSYWTMTPSRYKSNAWMFRIQANIASVNTNASTVSIRPVINIKSDTLFEEGGEGTSTNPYIVQGT